MRNRLISLLIAALALLAPACSNTVEGLEEDAEQNVDEVEQELEEEDNDG